MASIKVVLAEDHALLREGIARLIEGEPDLDLVGRAADLPQLLELIEKQSPDVVVTDIRMPPSGRDEGMQTAWWLREIVPEVGVVVLSQYAAPSYALALLEAGSSPQGVPAQGADPDASSSSGRSRRWRGGVR